MGFERGRFAGSRRSTAGRRGIGLVCLVWTCALIATSGQSLAGGRDVRSLEVGTAAEQLAVDGVTIPPGWGAVFVPSMSRSELEPHVRVLLGEEVVARGPTGTRLPVPAGRYRVAVGQGPLSWRAARTVDVTSEKTAVLSGFVGSLRVTAVDGEGLPRDVSYIVVSADGHRVYGPESTHSGVDYGGTRTWLLAPGTYRIVPGSDPERVRGTTTIAIAADNRVRVRLVVDDTERVIGSEPGDYDAVMRDQTWQVDWLVGGNLAFGHGQRQLNSYSGLSLSLEAFSDLGVVYDSGPHRASLSLGIAQRWVWFEPSHGKGIPLQKLDDSLDVELLYNLRAARAVGPYVRASARTSMLPKVFVADGAYDVEITDADGAKTFQVLGPDDTLELMPHFAPLVLQQGAGVAFTVHDDRVFGFGIRAGIAARQLLYGDGGRYVRDEDAGRLFVDTLSDDLDWGPEVGGWLRLRLGGWFMIRSDVDAFLGLDGTTGSGGEIKPVYAWTSTVSIHLAEWASLVYRVAVHLDDAALDELQYRQTLNLRLQYAIF